MPRSASLSWWRRASSSRRTACAPRLAGGLGEADAVGHRIVHGGERFQSASRIDRNVEKALSELVELAPLHQRKSLAALDVISRLLPGVPAIACFDTAFHASLPASASTYALPRAWRERFGIRRYGFHGLSHAYSSRRASELVGVSVEELGIVSCHLGSGASLAAILGGRSIDTTMGFTPLEGLVMATRCGSVDPRAAAAAAQGKPGRPPRDGRGPRARVSGLAGLAGSSSPSGIACSGVDVQVDHDGGAGAAALAFGVDGAALGFDECTADGEPESAPTGGATAGGIDAVEAVEHALRSAPVVAASTFRSCRTSNVGMERTPNAAAICGSSSMLTLATVRRPSYSCATWWSTGATARHGPHRGTQKSISMGRARRGRRLEPVGGDRDGLHCTLPAENRNTHLYNFVLV